MDEQYEVICLVGDINVKAAIFLYEDDDGNCQIELKMNDCSVSVMAENYFYALIELRKKLEPQNIKLLCKGCSRNVYPSPMILDMGSAIKAYKLTMGEKAHISELVNIFEPCREDEYASVKEQAEYYEQWLKS